MGSVFDKSFLDVTRAKYEAVATRQPICKTCNHDPLNRLTDEIRAVGLGQSDAATLDKVTGELLQNSRFASGWIEGVVPGVTAPPSEEAAQKRRLIPVTTL